MHPFEDLPVAPGTVGIQWFGQSSFALKDHAGTIVQIDPYFPRERPAERFIHRRPPLHEESLRTDHILLTHDPGDHTCIESINRIRGAFPDVRYVGPAESAKRLSEAGIPDDHFTIVSAGDRVGLGTMTVHAVWAKPPAGVPEDEIAPPDVTHLGFVVDAGDVRVYVSGDPINTFADHDQLLHPIQKLRPDIGLLTNHPSEGEFPFFAGSSRMAVALGLKAAVPAHYACFVTRNYDPKEWASHLPDGGPEPLIIGYNQSAIFAPER